jgi:hypothetical protein
MPAGKAAGQAMRKRKIRHRASLSLILIFCNRLPPYPFSQAASVQGQLG